MPNTNPKYTINSETGTKDKRELNGCYFQLQENSTTLYDFFSASDASLQTGITSGIEFSGFSFPNETYTWKMTATFAGNSVTGPWSNTDPTLENVDEPESGTFTAQATEPVDEEASSTAHA